MNYKYYDNQSASLGAGLETSMADEMENNSFGSMDEKRNDG